MGCSVVDVHNFIRDLKAFVEGADAHIILNEIARKQKVCEIFYVSLRG